MGVRLILRRDFQSGDGHAEAPEYKTVMVFDERLESHLSNRGAHQPFFVVGAEVVSDDHEI